MSTTVVHCKRELFTTYIGRPRQGEFWGYGNPFEIGPDGTRKEVICKYRAWLETGENFGNSNATPERRTWVLTNLPTLRGEVLGCWCKPAACHGDVLIELLNQGK